jgi:hypothetical protein
MVTITLINDKIKRKLGPFEAASLEGEEVLGDGVQAAYFENGKWHVADSGYILDFDKVEINSARRPRGMKVLS